MRWFLVSDAMLFGSLFLGYVMLRMRAAEWPAPFAAFPWLETLLLVGASAAFGAKRSQLIVSNALGLTFVVITLGSALAMIDKGQLPSSNLMLGSWFTLTGVLAFHVLAGAVFTGWLAGPAFGMATADRDRWLARIEAVRRYWLLLDLVWFLIVVGFYLI